MTHETTAQTLSEQTEFHNDALMVMVNRMRDRLFETLRQKVIDAGWDPCADDVTLTLTMGEPDPDTNMVAMVAEASRPAPEWVPYVETSPVAFCSRCGRSTWSAEELEQGACHMPQPSGQECGGTWVPR